MRWQRELKRATGESEQEAAAYFGFKRVSADEKGKLVLRHFHAVARKYDWMNSVLSFGLHHVWKRAAVGMLGLRNGDQVLDLCGGTGDLSVLAARLVAPNGRVILYDISRAMIDMGRSKLGGPFGAERIRWLQGNAERISLADRQFDAAIVGFGIRNLTNMERGLEEMYRVLRPRGRLMCLEFSKPKWPLFCLLYDLYSFYVMPLLGRVLADSREAYTYLPESIRLFPSPEELDALLVLVGFRQVHHRRFTNGIAVVHLGVKP